MLRLAVPPQISTQRFQTCLTCEFFRHDTRSCGTFIIGRKLKPDEIEKIEKENQISFDGKSVRLCGCKMSLKSQLAFARCPIGKWRQYYLDDEQIQELKAFMNKLPKTGMIDSKSVDILHDWLYKITKEKANRCSSCLQYYINEINSNIQAYENGNDLNQKSEIESIESQSHQRSQISETGQIDSGVSSNA